MADQPIVPIFDPGRGFRVWSEHEIYTGTGPGRYVPNVDDCVWSWTQGLFRVIEVDYTTGRSVLQKYIPPKETGGVDYEDVLLGGGPGPIAESYRIYVDTSVMPHTLAFDSRLRIYGSAADSVKVFKGTNIGSDGVVISRYYDQNGQLLGVNIPLEPVIVPEGENLAIKTPKVGHTVEELDDGELVTAVVYDDVGNAVSITRLLVKKTAFVRTVDESKRFVTGIHIESPFLSKADPRVLEYPINMPIQALSMVGVVTYSDGGVKRMPIDGTKFSLYGLNNYIATILGQRIPLVLTYKLSADEASYNAASGEDYHISEKYYAVTVKVDGAYSVKLYTYPVWIDAANGYRLEHFLYNLDREELYHVTPYVTLATNSPAFNPTHYGVVQNLAFAIDLNKVNGRFANYRHVQTVGVTLLAPGSDEGAKWQIQYTPNMDPVYGGAGIEAKLKFVNVNLWRLKIDCGAGSKEDWLEKVYYPLQPLFNPEVEVEAPEPNFFRLVMGDRIIECPISQWEAEFELPSGLRQGEVVYLEFFRRTATTDLELAIAGLPVQRI